MQSLDHCSVYSNLSRAIHSIYLYAMYTPKTALLFICHILTSQHNVQGICWLSGQLWWRATRCRPADCFGSLKWKANGAFTHKGWTSRTSRDIAWWWGKKNRIVLSWFLISSHYTKHPVTIWQGITGIHELFNNQGIDEKCRMKVLLLSVTTSKTKYMRYFVVGYWMFGRIHVVALQILYKLEQDMIEWDHQECAETEMFWIASEHWWAYHRRIKWSPGSKSFAGPEWNICICKVCKKDWSSSRGPRDSRIVTKNKYQAC